MEFDRTHISKVLLLGLVLFALMFMGSVLRDVKDVLLVTTLDVTQLVTLKLSAFYVRTLCLLVFFAAYRTNTMEAILIFTIYGVGLFSVGLLFTAPHMLPPLVIQGFYLIAEAWPAFVMTFLFWAMANQTFTFAQAGIIYPFLFFVFPSLALLLFGEATPFLMDNDSGVELQGYAWLLLGTLMFLLWPAYMLYRDRTRDVPSHRDEIASSDYGYLALIFVGVMCFSLCTGLLELMFKSQMKHLFDAHHAYNAFMVQHAKDLFLGALGIFILTFWVVHRFGWMVAALMTPLVVGVSSCALLVCFHMPALKGSAPIFPLIALQVIVVKGVAFLFMVTKEMAYIPLSRALRVHAKGVIDFLFAGVGVSISALLFLKVEMDIAPTHLYMVLIFVSLLWVAVTILLGKKIKTSLGTCEIK